MTFIKLLSESRRGGRSVHKDEMLGREGVDDDILRVSRSLVAPFPYFALKEAASESEPIESGSSVVTSSEGSK